MENRAAELHRPIAVRANPQKHLATIGIVGVIHIVAIYAIVTGLMPGMTHVEQGPFRFIPTVETPPPKPQSAVQHVEETFTAPNVPFAQAPDIDIARDASHAIFEKRGDPQPPSHPAATAAQGVTSTHTIPHYPEMAIRLAQQGTVTLRLSVAADGSVSDARVETSSGSSTLDEAAIVWVKAHWRYRPATDGTADVASTTLAAIRFDLKNAR